MNEVVSFHVPFHFPLSRVPLVVQHEVFLFNPVNTELGRGTNASEKHSTSTTQLKMMGSYL